MSAENSLQHNIRRIFITGEDRSEYRRELETAMPLPNETTPGDQPALVFLHGLGNTSKMFEDYQGNAKEYGYVTAALDFPQDYSQSFGFDEHGFWLNTQLKDLCNGKNIIIVGHSLGGLVTLSYLSDTRNETRGRVIGAVLTSTPAGSGNTEANGTTKMLNELLGKVPLGVYRFGARSLGKRSKQIRVMQDMDNGAMYECYTGLMNRDWREDVWWIGPVKIPIVFYRGAKDRWVNGAGYSAAYCYPYSTQVINPIGKHKIPAPEDVVRMVYYVQRQNDT
jgi:pimeloyl-ACP methyl ester carboxylesterase